MRPLLINPEIKAQAVRLVDFARANIYRPNKSENVPGDDPRHVLNVQVSYRCVFSFTEAPDCTLWRHLSISVPPKEKFPNPFAAYTIAQELFGFNGWDGKSITPPTDWQFGVQKEDHCVVLAQPIATKTPKQWT